ncbi:unnamed protein product [Symbiodinium natans]|uniref:Uncharacterized protein n=1 Tax=Symbiodinium natans TaxID=878477 RepID=A0A812KJQ2_9DINO|nr:unnamed protein product [Symbiodinium natans]
MPGALELPGALQRSHVPGPALFIAAVTKLKHLIQAKEAALQKESVALDLASATLAHMAQCEQQFRSEFSGELDKAKESEQEASRLTAALEDLHKDVKEVDAEAVQICERIAQTTAEMEKLEQDVSETMADVQQELRMATLDLRAVPQAIIDDFREAGPPSETLQLVFFAFLDALGVAESWEGVVSLFSGDFAQQLQDLELDDMLPTTARAQYLKRKGDIRDMLRQKVRVLKGVRGKIQKVEEELKDAGEAPSESFSSGSSVRACSSSSSDSDDVAQDVQPIKKASKVATAPAMTSRGARPQN